MGKRRGVCWRKIVRKEGNETKENRKGTKMRARWKDEENDKEREWREGMENRIKGKMRSIKIRMKRKEEMR